MNKLAGALAAIMVTLPVQAQTPPVDREVMCYTSAAMISAKLDSLEDVNGMERWARLAADHERLAAELGATRGHFFVAVGTALRRVQDYEFSWEGIVLEYQKLCTERA